MAFKIPKTEEERKQNRQRMQLRFAEIAYEEAKKNKADASTEINEALYRLENIEGMSVDSKYLHHHKEPLKPESVVYVREQIKKAQELLGVVN